MKDILIEALKNNSEKVFSTINMEQYRLFGDTQRKKYYAPKQRYEQPAYNKIQNFIYKRTICGLSIYNKKEIAEMTRLERKEISSTHKKAQREINVLKQKILIQKTNKFFDLFPNSPLAQSILNNSEVDITFKYRVSFQELRLNKDDIVKVLHEKTILPDNFYDIKSA
jgi:ABC-type Fe3+/spermidine/putrescine transport system ATPase subunit